MSGTEQAPRHVAIIMDGNGRWASRKSLPGALGHKAGVKSLRQVIETCGDLGIDVLTIFAFSSENWQRSQAEVRGLMRLFKAVLRLELKRLIENNIRLRFIGRRDRLDKKIQTLMTQAEQQTATNTGSTLVVAVDYGGQWDIAQAGAQVAALVRDGELLADEIDETVFAQHLALADLPPVDLCIRTGDEQRISNFLLWQLAYAELYFSEVLWPDFDAKAFTLAIEEFLSRQRRFGGNGQSDTEYVQGA